MLTRLSARAAEQAEARRWWILGVLAFSLLILVIDNSILNVAIPTIVRELDASNRELQWIVDAYTLVLAGLLLTAGTLGDLYGRRRALQAGFLIFGLGSLLSALADSAGQLIVTRGFMGIGAALIMPATLSIITNVFPAHERPKAIGIWAATAGVAAVLGPLTGGFLLEHFYFGSIFLVNLPIVAVGLVAGVFLIPDSKDPQPRRLDPAGAGLSIVSLVALVYAVIEAPERGWTGGATLVGFALGAVGLAAFFWWERRSDHPMLDLAFFRNPRFSAASGAIALLFFAMFGSIFVLTQYFQFVHGYSPLQTGVRLLAFAVPMMIFSPLSARIAERIGTKLTVASGLGLLAMGLASAVGLDEASSYGTISWRLVLMAAGIGLTMAPATESIMGSLPLGKAGVGSAVNDTTRMVGGAVGVAVVGSVFSSVYGSQLADAVPDGTVPTEVLDGAEDSLGFALAAAERIGGPAGRAFADAATSSFVDGFHAGFWVAAGVAVVAGLSALLWLPARARGQAVDGRESRDGADDTAVTAGVTPDGPEAAPADQPSPDGAEGPRRTPRPAEDPRPR